MSAARQRIQSLKLGAAAQMLPLTAGYTANILATPYVLSRLGLHDFGIWSLTGAIAQYAALLDLGVSRAANRYVALYHARGDTRNEGVVVGICMTALLVLGTVLTGLIIGTSHLLNGILRTENSGLTQILLMSAVSILILGLMSRVLAAASVGRGRLVPAGLGIAILSAVQTAGGVIAISIDPGLKYFALGSAAGAAAGLLVVIAIILIDEKRIVIARPRAGLVREVLAYGINSQVAAAGDLLLMQSGKLIAGIMIGPSAAGVYDLASKVALGAQAFGGASAAALTPHLTRRYVDAGIQGIHDEYQRLTQRNTSVTIFVPFAMMATAVSAIPLWLGSQNLQVTLILLALLPGIAVNVSTGVCTSALSAMGRPSITAIVTLVAGVFQLLLTILSTHLFGFGGLAAAFAIGVPVAKVGGVWRMQAKIRIPMSMYIRGVRGPYVCALAALAASLPIGLIIAPTVRNDSFLPFTLSVAIFTAIYCAWGWRRGYLPALSFARRS